MLQAKVNDRKNYEITEEDGRLFIDGAVADLDIQWQPNGLISILHNGRSYTGLVEKIDPKTKELSLLIDGQTHTVVIKEPIDQLLSSMGMDLKAMHKLESVKAPMPGMILKLLVEPGQVIKKGDGLLILEAMKMENVIKATGNATVKSIKVTERIAVEKGTILIELE